MQVRFGYCSASMYSLSRSDAQNACAQAIRSTTGTARMENGQYRQLDERLKKIETAVTTIADRFSRIV